MNRGVVLGGQQARFLPLSLGGRVSNSCTSRTASIVHGRDEHGVRKSRRPCRCSMRAMTVMMASSATPQDSCHGSVEGMAHFFTALYKFSRPHTMLGTFISVISISMLAVDPTLEASVLNIAWFIGQALVPALLMNICIVGLNQIYDVEIDKINKPYLPIASGELSLRSAWNIVCGSGATALALGFCTQSLPLLATLVGSLALGIAYSIDAPFLRWKQYPTAAAMCILSVRAVLVQFGFFFHMKFCQLPSILSNHTITIQQLVGNEKSLLFATAFMFIFSIVIALFKDIPDMQGDEKSGLKTLTVRLGPKRVFWACMSILQFCYVSSIAFSYMCIPNVLIRWCSIVAHAGVGLFLLSCAKKTNLDNPGSIYKCYMDVWKAFYIEYLLIPLLRM